MSTQQFNFWSSKRQRKRSAESYRIGFRNAKLNRKEQNVDSYRPTPHIFVTLKRRRYRRQRQRSVHKVGVYDEWPKGNGLNGGVVKYSRYCPGNDVDRLRKTTRSHDSLIPTVIRNRHKRKRFKRRGRKVLEILPRQWRGQTEENHEKSRQPYPDRDSK